MNVSIVTLPMRLEAARRVRERAAVIVDPAPQAAPTLNLVCDAMLVALGKVDVLGSARRSAAELLAAWLSVTALGPVIVCDAELLGADPIVAFVGLLTEFATDVWLTVSTNRDARALRRALRAAGITVALVPVEALDAAVPLRTAPPPVVRPGGLPRVPRVDGIAFRSACRKLLGPEDFALVDRLFSTFVRELRATVARYGTAGRTARLLRELRDQIEQAESLEELVLRVRAAQVATLTEGWLVTVETVELHAAAHLYSRRGLATEERWWDELDAYRDPDVGAAAACWVSGVDAAAIGALALHRVTEHADGSVTVRPHNASPVGIAPGPARYVRALLAWRRRCGAEADDPLFVTDATVPRQRESVRTLLARPSEELGLAIALGPVPAVHHDDRRFLATFGIRVHELVRRSARRTAA